MSCSSVLRTAVLIAALAPFAAGQAPYVRTLVPILPFHSNPVGMHSVGNRSVVICAVLSDQSLRSTTSDGRGLAWSAPVSIASLIDGGGSASAMVGARVYVVYKKHADSSLWLNRSDDAGQTWNAPHLVATAASAGGDTFGLALAAAPNGADDRVFVIAQVFNAPARLFVSHDSGTSFAPTQDFPTVSGYRVRLNATGPFVHTVYRTNTGGPDRFDYRRSSDGGLSFAAPQTLDVLPIGATSAPIYEVCVEDSTVLVFIRNVNPLRLYSRTSFDDGITFQPLVPLPDVGAVNNWANPFYLHDGIAMTTWINAQAQPDPRWYESHSFDGGLTWSAPFEFTSLGLDSGGTTLAELLPAGGKIVHVTQAFPKIRAMIFDPGAGTWGSPFAPLPDGAATFAGVDNERYRNVILCGSVSAQTVIGGFRPQTIDPQGFVAGATQVNFAAHHFEPAIDPTVWVILSTTTGNLFVPDGRNLGLGASQLLVNSVLLASVGFTSTIVGPTGAGATPPLPVTLPPGVTLHAVGFGIDPATKKVGNITDVRTFSF